MLSEAKHLHFFCSRNVRNRSEILRFAQNDMGRCVVVVVSSIENKMPIRAKYVHTNLIATDWKRLVRFYCEVFGCEPKGPERDLSGTWLDSVNAVPNAHLRGVHLLLPGYGDNGPTLEIFSYDQLIERELPRANECGFAHIAFAVDDVDQALQTVIAAGGGAVGEIATAEVDGVGLLRVVYARDPEGNIVELQKWS
jgi:predicted enzyme related to lactoylglutathione lyase